MEDLWQVLRMCDGDKLSKGIKSMHEDILACVRVKGCEGELFRRDSGVRQGCIRVMKKGKMGRGRRGVRFLEDGRKWRLPGFLYADDLVLCGESEEELRKMLGRFIEVCKRRGLKFNAGKSKVMVLNGEERLECDLYVDGIRLEHVSEFKYLGCVLMNQAEMGQSIAGRWRVGGGLQVLSGS